MKGNKLHALAIAVAAPAVLVAATGTAHADGRSGLVVWWAENMNGGLQAWVRNEVGSTGQCTYNAVALHAPWMPGYHYEFSLPPYGEHNWTIWGPAWGITWNTVVLCWSPESGGVIGAFERTAPY